MTNRAPYVHPIQRAEYSESCFPESVAAQAAADPAPAPAKKPAARKAPAKPPAKKAK